MAGPSVLSTEAYKVMKEDYEAKIYAGPTYIYIYIYNVCWKFEYRQNVCKFSSENWVSFLTKCDTKKSKWIFKSCRKSLFNKSIPMQPEANNIRLSHKYNELEI